MQRVFNEIKKAIEEEMRNAEGRPPTGPREGGRRAQEYAEWLKQEQERLRDGSQPEPLEQQSVATDGMTEQEWEERKVRRPDPERHLEQPQRREGQPARQRRDRELESRRPETSTQYQRSEARHRRDTASAYEYGAGRGSYLKSQVQGLLRSPQGLRQAFILREIVSKPVSLRDKDDHLIS